MKKIDREKKEIRETILRNIIECFIEKTFGTLNPGTKYLNNSHIQKIADKLHDLEDGKIKRLVINIPPRYLKSISVSVSWPAFLLGRDPARRVVVASHNNALAVKHSVDTRKIMRTDWYKELFPNVKFMRDQNTKEKFMTADSGFRLATSVGGGITGEGGNFLIVDDPITPDDALNVKSRKQLLKWFNQTFSTRLDDKKNGVMIVVMQRLHKDDLSATLLERGWDHLCLPVINSEGVLLHEEREGWEEVERLREDMGEYSFSAQYMQNPLAMEGGVIKAEWFRFYDEFVADEETQIYQSWDTAIKTNDSADYTVCLTIAANKNGYYVLDCLREKLSYPDLKRRFAALTEKWKPEAILIEDKSSGQSLLQDLQQETKLPVIGMMPKDNKLMRLNSVTPMIEAGKLFLPAKKGWAEALQAELVGFPDAGNDDMVDALSQFLKWAKGRDRWLPSIRKF